MQQLSNSSQLRGSNFLSERSYSPKCLSSICSSMPGSRHRQAAGADMLGSTVLPGHFRRQWGTGFKTNTEQEWQCPLLDTLARKLGRRREDGSSRCLCDLFKTLGIWCGGLLRDSGCLTLGDLQESLQSKDSARYKTKVALQVLGTGTVQVHQCSQICYSHNRALTLGTHHPTLEKERPALMQNTWTARGCLVKGSQ